MTIDGKYFQAFDEDGRKVTPERVTKPVAAHVLMSVRPDGRAISFFGDLHPSYAGNVVKAMASAKQGYPVVSRWPQSFIRRVAGYVDAAARRRAARERARGQPLTPTIVEVVVRALMAARASSPDNSIGCRTTRRWRTPPMVPVWPRRGSRSPAPRSIAERVSSPPLCSRWAGPPTCARSFGGRAGGVDGSDRTPDRDAVGRNRASDMAGSATRCCSRSGRRCAPTAAG